MDSIFSVLFWETYLSAAIRMSIPIILASTGGIISEKSGVCNVNIEGQMLMGAAISFIVAYFTQSPILGFISGVIVGIIFSLILAILAVHLNADQVISGVALNLLATGLSSYAYRAMFGIRTKLPDLETSRILTIPLLSKIPVLGKILFVQPLLFYLSIALAFLAFFLLYKTTLGLKIRAAGEKPEAGETMGVSIKSIRTLGVLMSGALSGLAGTFLTLTSLGHFSDNMSSGRGFVALAVIILCKWNPKKAILASFIFGLADALQLRLQAMGLVIPYQFMLMLPYLVTLIAMVIVGRNAFAPAAICKPYERGSI